MQKTLLSLAAGALVGVLATPAHAQLPPVEVVHLVHLEAGATAQLVAPLLGREGQVHADRQTNSLIVIDDTEHVRRVRALVARLETLAADRNTRTRPARARRSRER